MIRLSSVLLAAFLTVGTTPLFAQQEAQPVETARIRVPVSLDFRNAYMFRGVRQDDTGLITWPSAEIGLRLRAAEHGLTNARVLVGTFNSLNSGWAGSTGFTGKRWYESDVYTTLSLAFAKTVAVDTTFTVYRSPNKMFTTTKEVGFRVGSNRVTLPGLSLKPYALVAFELDTKPGIGQLDGGFKSGRYLELGATPVHRLRRVDLAVPVKVGLSIGNYYELAGKDRQFGFVGIGGMATLPIGRSLNVHGGVEYEHLGAATKAFNGGDGSRTTETFGIGFAY